MVHYEFKPPNLLEIIILITIIVLALWLISYTNTVPTTLQLLDTLAKENINTATYSTLKAILNVEYTQAVLLLSHLIAILFLATIMEGIRDKL